SYRAIEWMRHAAERGNFDAQKTLGRLYLTGLAEMGSDPAEAQKWLTITAGRGDRQARNLLKEASEARRSQKEEQRWSDRWRLTFYNKWNSGYPYYWQWGTGRWYLGY
ncbi:MAG: sel1 repeat family protein, partial [Methylococcales bacterium]